MLYACLHTLLLAMGGVRNLTESHDSPPQFKSHERDCPRVTSRAFLSTEHGCLLFPMPRLNMVV
jgi:hypothetical protein